MIRYVQKSITPVNGAVTMASSPAVIGVAGKTRKILGVYTTPTATIGLRCYYDGDEVVDVISTIFTYIDDFIPLDIVLEEGRQFKVGLHSSSGTTAQQVVVKYEET